MKRQHFLTWSLPKVYVKLDQRNALSELQVAKRSMSLSTADGKMLPPMIIFKGKTTKTIKKLRIPDGFIIKTQAKAWMDEELMHVWLEDIWLKHTKLMSQKLGFENLLLTFDAFSAHKTDEVEAKLVQNKSDILMIQAGCSSKCQPMDVCINKPFKANLRKCWVGYVAKMIDESMTRFPHPVTNTWLTG